MNNVYLFLAFFFILTYGIGYFLEKIKTPWVFASLMIGGVLSFYNPFLNITSTDSLVFLSDIGMYLLLFIIGLKLDLKEVGSQKGVIVKATFTTIILTVLVVGVFVHYYFNLSWGVSLLVASSFATVGEAILVPILDELNLVNTKFGQLIIGIGTLDDILEVTTLVALSFIVESTGVNVESPYEIIASLIGLFVLFFILLKVKNSVKKFMYLSLDSLFLLCLFILFLFLGIGEYADASAIGALLGGVVISNFIPKDRFDALEKNVKSVAYGFFVPLFFLMVGLEVDFNFIASHFWLIFIFWLLSLMAKIIASYFTVKNIVGIRHSILLGLGLSIRFSTSLVLIKILLDKHIIEEDLYSMIIATSIVFKFFVPVTFAYLNDKWKKYLITENS
jgi:Ca2+-transporting ATPase